MRAAVPDYVERHFPNRIPDQDSCPPGHRFGLYFSVWKDDWTIEDKGKSKALQQTLALPPHAQETLKHLRERQAILLDAFPEAARLSLEAESTAPFATGLGMEHPLENGFAFLNPYGLAYLPGSSIKGVLRRAAEELAGELIEDGRKDWNQDAIKGLFGLESEDRQKDPIRGALTFWDALPKPAGNSMGMEVMTPHYSDYYQAKRTDAYPNGATPHDSGQPNPIVFLVVPAESEFSFHLTCDVLRLTEPLGATWQELMRAAFEHAFGWLGFGAKTAVGYGAMEQNEGEEAAQAGKRADRLHRAQEIQAAAERQAVLGTLTPNLRRIEDFKSTCAARIEQLRGGKEKLNTGIHSLAIKLAKDSVEGNEWAFEEKRAAAEAIETWLPRLVERLDRKDEWKEARKKLRLAVLKGDA